MTKLITLTAIALAMAGCVNTTSAPSITLDANHPAHPDAPAAPMPAPTSNTLAIETPALTTTAPAPATKEATHEQPQH